MIDAARFCFQAYFAIPELERDFHIIADCGQIQRWAVEAGDDTTAGWFAHAAWSYPPCPDDPVGDLARRTCQLLAVALHDEVPS